MGFAACEKAIVSVKAITIWAETFCSVLMGLMTSAVNETTTAITSNIILSVDCVKCTFAVKERPQGLFSKRPKCQLCQTAFTVNENLI